MSDSEEQTVAVGIVRGNDGNQIGIRVYEDFEAFYAEGEATETLSDLDVRIVVTQKVDGFGVGMVESKLKNEVGPELVPDVCGYLDAYVNPNSPGEKYASILIWERGSDE